jgi:ligand-binding sensor domain-containing protein/signal transduction histidine kinase
MMRLLCHRFPSQALICLFAALLFSPSASPLDPAHNAQRYAVQSWNTENGLPQNSVHTMLQTADGYLWMGTENGLARFNGYQFRIFNKDTAPQLAGNDIRSLFEDRSHTLWIGTATGLTRMSNGTTRTFTTRDGLPSDSVRAILQTHDGTLWVLTSAGLTELTGTNNQHFQASTTAAIQSIAQTPQGDLLAATYNGLLHIRNHHIARLTATAVQALACDVQHCVIASAEGMFQVTQTQLTTLASREAIPAGGVRSLLLSPAGVWITGDVTATLIPPHGNAIVYKTGAQLPGQQIESIFADRKHTVWIGTNEGITRWSSGQLTSTETGTSSAILSFFEDHDGDLWAGTETAGVLELRDRPFDLIGRAQGIAGAATSVAAAADQGLWIGTRNGGASLVDMTGAARRTLTLKDGLASNTVLALATDRSDLWIGTPDGLSRLHNNRITTLTTKDGLADDFVRSLLITHDGGVWIGTRHGVTRWLNNTATTWTTTQGLGSDLIGAMLEDSAGNVWIGTLHGLARYSNGQLHNFTTADGLPSETVTALFQAKDGDLWIGTNGGGLAFFRNNRITAVPSNVVPSAISAILQDNTGNLWVSSEQGLDRITDAHGNTQAPQVTHYGTADGLGSSGTSDTGHPSAVRLMDGRLCFAARKGILTVDPTHLPSDGVALPIVIEQITADDHDISLEQLASLPPGIAHLAINFAAIHLAAPQRVQYRYMLEGFDPTWIEAGTLRTAFYTNLPHGHYRFRVNARSDNGPWSDLGTSTIPVNLRPMFYQTWWFRTLLLCLLALILFGLYRLRLRALNSRFRAVAAERSRLAREIHDTLAQGFVAVSVRLEMMARMLGTNRTEEARHELDATRTLVQEGLEEARRSIWNLRAEDSDRPTLPQQLDRIVQDTINRGTDAELEVTGAYHPLPAATEEELLRITQEGVANALRHGNPATLYLRLVYTRNHLQLDITDDGTGFDVENAPAKDSGHYGLTGLRERAEQIGGKLMIQSAPQQGTTVRVELTTTRNRNQRTRL